MREGRKVYKQLDITEFYNLLDFFTEIEKTFYDVGGDGKMILKSIIEDRYTSSELLDTLYRNNLTISVRK